MLVDKYRNGSIGYMLGKRTFTVPDRMYLGISLTPIKVDGTGITEPAANTKYKRVELANNTTTWSAPSKGVATNNNIIEFPEIEIESAPAIWYFLSENATGTAGTIWADAFPSPRPLAQYTTLYINAGDLKFEFSN